VRLTNESNQAPKPEVFFVGYHHARELITAELPLYFVVYAATNFYANETLRWLLNRSEIYVVVALNVDGFSLFAANGYQRCSATGVDLNRNYGYSWNGTLSNVNPETYAGAAPFSEPETQAIRDFVLEHSFKYALSFHSGIQLILYPWAYTEEPTEDKEKFKEIAQGLSENSRGTKYVQANALYYSYGSWDDWMYGEVGVYALTCEIFVGFMFPSNYDVDPYLGWRVGMGEGQAEVDCIFNLFGHKVVYSHSTYMKDSILYLFNPLPENIEEVILTWLPVFFYMTDLAISDFQYASN
jgi:hypothetical protein